MRQLLSVGRLYSGPDSSVLVVIWTEDSQIYKAEHSTLKIHEVNEDVLNTLNGTPIPKTHIQPPWTPDTTAVAETVLPQVHIKTQQGLWRYDGSASIADAVREEVRILETISRSPHPNLCHYYGCIQEGDRIAGIGLQKYKCTLFEAMSGNEESQSSTLDVASVAAGIQAGLDHLHSLGLAHNDINPHNIMLDDSGNPVIVDFDSCASIGATTSAGTPGWSKWPAASDPENDTHGFNLVIKFLRGEYNGELDDDAMGW
ncbi:unnamed protein product [Cyclocybe aegerita]|uniref:Protein kinase domain-containing protein n=1 Tax=Cyclocybe aegerita TaxID=1973307 RepID=A0A8S0VTN9_CYCAE|nr:unnamed protein product [Cyclocybe aegerita]